MKVYGHPAPCLVTLIDGGPTVMVQPLRFIPVSELPLHGGSPGTVQSAGVPLPASADTQMRAVSAPRSSDRRRSRHVLSEHHFIG